MAALHIMPNTLQYLWPFMRRPINFLDHDSNNDASSNTLHGDLSSPNIEHPNTITSFTALDVEGQTDKNSRAHGLTRRLQNTTVELYN